MKQDYNATGLDVQSTGTQLIGFVQTHEYGGSGFVEKVVAQIEDNTNPEFNVNIDGSAIFSSTQSLAAANTPETFVPDQNRHFTGPSVAVQLDVTTSASAANNMDIGVLVDDSG